MHIALALHRIRKNDGHGRVNYEVIRGALRHGHKVTVLAAEVAPELLEHPNISWVRLTWSKRYTTLIGNVWFAVKSTSVLKKQRSHIDVVKLNGFTSFYPADVNAVHMVHETASRSLGAMPNVPQPLFKSLYRKLYMKSSAALERRAFQQAKVLVAVSEKVKEELLTHLKLPPEKVRTIVNGVDTLEFCPGHQARTALGLPENEVLGLFVGDIRTYGKNLDTVLKALALVPELHLAVAGDTKGSPFPALAQQLGVADRVHFLGFRRDIPQLMRACDLFVFPSRYEACSLVLLEAMASGLPIVTAQTAGGCELMTPESGMVLPDPNDVQALAQTLCNLLVDRERLRAMGRAARAIAEQHTWELMADRYVALFEELCAQ
ncbi:glycosyltransferase [Chthonomonas calidirosea]|uniref:Glycosyltransferase n=1 Tax=Chthonomonas calidirosea (strain DSM 23976 / ICMP 18418 / T49) TaxID=1303518 RepID=S0EY78_CHTCT|nr:glycosyltransferase family 4 protein [Chthonomonas calidirosea]CCW36540.1 Glycosyltransferase [Chthonomonas calidirosea T49]CEK17031.1 glycosyltransferase [Chthonomonas calidirosea]